MNKTKKFIKLIQENPNLPVLPLVASDVVCDDSYYWWIGSFADCEVNEHTCVEMYNNDRFITRDDFDEVVEYFINELLDEDESLSAEEVEKLAIEKFNRLDWQKAIIVWVGV